MKNVVKSGNKAITLVALVITIIVLLLLAGIVIASLGGENGLFSKVKEAKKMQLESEMREQLTIALQELQVEKRGNATLDDVTQDWMNEVISNEYNPELQEDASYSGKLIVMSKNNIIGKFMLDANLDIAVTEYNTSSVEIEYTTISRTDNKVKINIVVTDKINGVKQIEYPEGNPLKVVSGTKEQISIDYEVQLGREYKFVITTGDGNKTEKIIKIDDYYYNVTKDLDEGSSIDNMSIKTAYNKTYEAIVSTEENYVITNFVVTMDGQVVTTSESDIVDINTGKIKIEKVTGDVNIIVTTKKLKIKYTAIAVSTSKSVNNTNTLGANTQERGTTLYVNIIATLESNRCSVVLKTDDTKFVPYAVTKNGKYVFKVSGTYNGKLIEEEKEVVVNQYKSASNIVQYDAGEWTKEEIEELKNNRLYMLNKEKTNNSIYNLKDNSGLNFTFGGFTYKGDTTNENDIKDGKIITSRNKSTTPESGWSWSSQYSGWQILEIKDSVGNIINNEIEINKKIDNKENEKIYVTKIVHAGSPENFVYYGGNYYDNMRAEYLLSGGERRKEYNTLASGERINPRNLQMYVDNAKKDLISNIIDNEGKQIKDIHIMTYDEAIAISGDKIVNEGIRTTGAFYWLASAYEGGYNFLMNYVSNGISHEPMDNFQHLKACWGIRPVVTMAEGVYIKSGSGTEEDPYILGKD